MFTKIRNEVYIKYLSRKLSFCFNLYLGHPKTCCRELQYQQSASDIFNINQKFRYIIAGTLMNTPMPDIRAGGLLPTNWHSFYSQFYTQEWWGSENNIPNIVKVFPVTSAHKCLILLHFRSFMTITLFTKQINNIKISIN